MDYVGGCDQEAGFGVYREDGSIVYFKESELA